jgi:hypothetical protein
VTVLERIPPPSAEVMAHTQRERFRELVEDVFSGGVLGCRFGSTLFAGPAMATELRRAGFSDALDCTGILLTRLAYASEFGEELQAVWVLDVAELGLA